MKKPVLESLFNLCIAKFSKVHILKNICVPLLWLCIKPGIEEGGTECGECPQTFREMLPNIAENVAKHSEEFLKHSRECC